MGKRIQKCHKIFVLTFTGIIIAGFLVGSIIPVRADETFKQQALVDKARITFESFIKDRDMEWFNDHLKEAKGLLIIPSLLKAGFIIGGSGGSGVLLTKDERTGKWGQPAFYTIGSVTFGLQIGGEAAEVIMLVRTQRGVDQFYTTDFKLGGDTSIAAGPVGVGAKANIAADVISFSRTKGVYAGLNLEGAVIKANNKSNRVYYGKELRPVDILVKREVSNPGSERLRKVVAKAAR